MPIENIFREYEIVLYDIYGIYLDSIRGFKLNKNDLIDRQVETMKEKGFDQTHMDNVKISYVDGFDRSNILHETTQKDFIVRNSNGNSNSIMIGNLCLSQAYSYWEYYRTKIAKSLSIKITDVTSNVFGELARTRNSIIHNTARAKSNFIGFTGIKSFKESEAIQFDEYQIESIFKLLKSELNTLQNSLQKNESVKN